MKRTRSLYVPAAAAAVLLTAGPVASATAASATAVGTRPASAAAARADVDAAGAAAAALKKYPGFVESLDKDGSVWHVDVIGKNGKAHSEVEVSAAGAVTRSDSDTEQDGNEYKTLLAAKVDAAKAMKAALAATPGKVWSLDWDNDNDNGVADYWSVEIKSSDGSTKNVGVDAKTGKIVPADSDNDGDNDNDNN
ncbi:PepSY domain-containing protein [Streptomyces sp. NPDC087917]|uniref:PepSY domain-containing protein n=1 Tax=Streptomyces sp. NPDC087917 TaxID=3155060 RepID=UPI0034303052